MLAGQFAPSGKNLQEWHFVVVENPDVLHRLEELLGEELGRPGYHFYGAPAIILCANKKGARNAMADCSAALQNMMLAAHSLGLGTCYINVVKQLFAFSFGSEIKQQLGVPEDYIATGSITLGYPDEDPEFAPKNMDCDSIY